MLGMPLEAPPPGLMTRRSFALELIAALLPSSAMNCLAAEGPPLRDGKQKDQPWDPRDFGARGDGRVKDTIAIQRAIDTCSSAGGGVVTLAPGCVFLSGSITLRSHVELHLSGGATLLASPDRDDFRTLGSLLFAKDAEDIHVSGTGEIDGNFEAFFPPKGPAGYSVPQPFLGPFDPLYDATHQNPQDGRPRMILLVNCRQVLLEQITIRDSPTWTIHPVGCEGLRITGISILNDLDVPNCDGIDIDHCREVRVDGCNIVAGDDCIVLKSSRNFGHYGACENIVVTNCTLESSSAGIKIETEGAYSLRSAVISNCSIVRSNRGISFLNRDGATVEDILFTDLTIETRMHPMMWWGSGEAIAISSVPRSAGGAPGVVQRIQFNNISCKSESGVYLRGSPDAPLRQISFAEITLEIGKITSIPGGFYDMRPGDAFGNGGLDRRDTAGIFASDVEGLSLNGVTIAWSGVPSTYYGAAVELHRCRNVSLMQLSGKAAHAGGKAAIFDDVTFTASIAPPSPS